MAETSDRWGESEDVSPADAFGVLSNEIRIDVLRALYRADGPQSYADVRQAVAYGGSGNFNYHLRKLVGHFVRKTDAGYVLTRAGERVSGMVVAGALTGEGERRASRGTAPCALCGGVGSGDRARRSEAVGCANCGGTSPSVAAGGATETADGGERIGPAADRAVVHGARLGAALSDVCPECRGPTTVSLETCPDHDDGSERCLTCGTWFAAWARCGCQRCPFAVRFPAAVAALYDPAVVAAVARCGPRAVERLPPPVGEAPVDGRDVDDAVVGTDPHRISVRLRLEAGTVTALLDETLGVRSVEPPAADGE